MRTVKIRQILLTFLLVLVMALPAADAAQGATTKKTRRIHLVYDDSESMTWDEMGSDGGTSWSQAKYALEIFSAMAGETDTLAVYPMSAFYTDGSMDPSMPLILDGTSSGQTRVDKVASMANFAGTPIESVERAGSDLVADDSDEKWLVILTDGSFTRSDNSSLSQSEAEKTILGFADEECRVVYCGIGVNAMQFTGSKDGFTAMHTDTDTILETVTEIATTVFNLQKIPHTGSGTVTFEPDIPLSRVIILAQGQSVTVSDLQLDGGAGPQASESVPVSVTPQTDPAMSAYEGLVCADGLEGRVVTYKAADEQHPFAPGSYSFTTNTDNIEIYYEPGVLLTAVIEPGEGDPVDLMHDSTDTLPTGKWKVKLSMINPLTGEELNPEDSPLLEGADLRLHMKDSDGKETDVRDGEDIELKEGPAELQVIASFPGDIEMRGDLVSTDVGSAALRVAFGETKYELDPLTLTPSAGVEVTVTKANGNALPDADLAGVEFSFTGTDGINWKAEHKGGGVFALTPEYADADAGAAGVAMGKRQMEAEAWIGEKDGERRGTGRTVINIPESVTADLAVEMELPAEKVEAGGKQYMFDPALRGAGSGGAYITVRFSVARSDGSRRSLTDAELEQVMANFSYASSPKNASLLWKLISLLCFQKLEFEAVPGTEPSSCQLYLAGERESGIRPNLSHLKVSTYFTFENGLKAQGSAEGDVSVKPLPVLDYILPALIVSAAILLILTLVIMELRKPRFSRDIVPVTTGMVTENGTPKDPSLLPRPKYGGMKIEHRFFPPAKPEERNVMMQFPGYMSPIMFRIRAVRGGGFMITDLTPFQGVKEKIMFNGVSYDLLSKKPKVFTSGSVFKLSYTDDSDRVTVIQSFRKPKEQKQK